MYYKITFTNKFKKDVKLAKKQGKNLEKLFTIIEKLQNGEKLAEIYKDHELKGEYKGFRECHIEPDFLLIYIKKDDILILTLVRLGSHSLLFSC